MDIEAAFFKHRPGPGDAPSIVGDPALTSPTTAAPKLACATDIND
jgi:hypothetical protein